MALKPQIAQQLLMRINRAAMSLSISTWAILAELIPTTISRLIMSNNLAFPLHLSFKLLAIATQFYVHDANGNSVAYVKQKLFKFKEAVTVFTDESQADARFHIQADRVIDFSAQYNFTDAQGNALGCVKQRGLRSLWKAGFEVMDNGQCLFHINERSMLTRFLDGLFGQIPFIGLLSGYLFQPAYEVSRPNGQLVMVLTKQPALFEGRFDIDLDSGSTPLSAREADQLLLSLMMVVILERSRG